MGKGLRRALARGAEPAALVAEAAEEGPRLPPPRTPGSTFVGVAWGGVASVVGGGRLGVRD